MVVVLNFNLIFFIIIFFLFLKIVDQIDLPVLECPVPFYPSLCTLKFFQFTYHSSTLNNESHSTMLTSRHYHTHPCKTKQK